MLNWFAHSHMPQEKDTHKKDARGGEDEGG